MYVSPMLFINLFSIFTMLIVIIPIWRIRDKNGARELFFVLLFMLVWSMGSLSELMFAKMKTILIWRNLTQIGVFYTPVASLLFAIAYTGIGSENKKLIARVSYSLQSIGILLVWTDTFHHLIRGDYSILETPLSVMLVIEPTILAKTLISFNLLFLFIALGIFGMYAIQSIPILRKQSITMIIGMLIVTVFTLFRVIMVRTISQMAPFYGVFALYALLLILGVHRYDLLRIAPLAREQVFHFLGDGLVIATSQGTLLEANQAALSMMGPTLTDLSANIGKEIPAWDDLLKQGIEGEFSFYGKETFFTCSVYTIKSRHEAVIGTISLLKDTTEQKRKNDLLKARAELDGLTGIYNRHTFIEKVENLLSENTGGNSLVFFDIDHFKLVNDKYGHIAGDRVLQAVVACASQALVGSDIIGRMGGEEFAIFHATENKEETLTWVENLRKQVEEATVQVDGNTVSCTISIGLCFSKTASFDSLYRNADKELYKAKDAGRNCIRYTYIKDP